MLEEEILRLRSGVLADEQVKQIEDWAPQISTGIPIMIPETYVRDLGIRLGLYKRIGDIKDKEALDDIKEELIDRFGKLPIEVENLLATVEIKTLCRQASIDRIDAGSKGLLIGFRNNIFTNPEKLMDLIISSFGTIKVRPDQRLFIEKDLSSYETRVNTIKQYVSKIAEIA